MDAREHLRSDPSAKHQRALDQPIGWVQCSGWHPHARVTHAPNATPFTTWRFTTAHASLPWATGITVGRTAPMPRPRRARGSEPLVSMSEVLLLEPSASDAMGVALAGAAA